MRHPPRTYALQFLRAGSDSDAISALGTIVRVAPLVGSAL
jgi:hypothetical protein